MIYNLADPMLDTSPRALARSLSWPLREPAETAIDHIQQGAFQRSMSVLVAGTSIVSGLEVAYEHYKGSYSNPIMYSPVILSGVLATAAYSGILQPFCGANISSLHKLHHACRWRDRLRLSYSRHRTQARRMAVAGNEYCHGAAYLCPIALRHERLSRSDRQLPAAGRGLRPSRPCGASPQSLATKRFSQRYPHRTLSAASLRSGGPRERWRRVRRAGTRTTRTISSTASSGRPSSLRR